MGGEGVECRVKDEVVWVKIGLGNQEMAVGVVYLGHEGIERSWNQELLDYYKHRYRH